MLFIGSNFIKWESWMETLWKMYVSTFLYVIWYISIVLETIHRLDVYLSIKVTNLKSSLSGPEISHQKIKMRHLSTKKISHRKRIVDIHNHFRASVNPPAKDMLKMVSLHLSNLLGFIFQTEWYQCYWISCFTCKPQLFPSLFLYHL